MSLRTDSPQSHRATEKTLERLAAAECPHPCLSPAFENTEVAEATERIVAAGDDFEF